MTFSFQDFAKQVKANDAITPRDTLALRQWHWEDGKISAAEANALFELNTLGKSKDPNWINCFVEAISEFVINGLSPKGYVSVENATWLMNQIDKDGRVESLGELELLVTILEKATNAPDSLKVYALAQIEVAVLHGNGPLRSGGVLQPSTINAEEVHLLRRILFGPAGEGGIYVTRAEADCLFRIKDTTLLHNNAPEWQTLFVQGVGNHLMAHARGGQLSRERAAELEAFMNDTQTGIGGFFARMRQSVLSKGLINPFESKFASVDHESLAEEGRKITPEEQAWLQSKIDADATIDPLERALLTFIAEESCRQFG